MTDDQTGMPWTPATFAAQLEETSEQAVETQAEWFKQLMTMGAGSNGSLDIGDLSTLTGTATFKTRIQSGGRISIPDAEREALDIEEGDIVQTIVIPVKRTHGDSQ
ncbi:MAG: hypothetical protein ACI91T_003181 [Natronomonas sp.]|jgi:hypothetical protein